MRWQPVVGRGRCDAGGAPIAVDPAGGDLSIAADGAINQKGKTVAVFGLFTLDGAAKLTRYDNSSVMSDREAAPVVNFAKTGLMQGSLEQSNVNPLTELTRLIDIQRAFDHISACMNMSDSAQQDAIRTLGAQT